MKLGRLLRNDDGGVTILAAILLPVMIGLSALVLEFGGSLLTKVQLQRVADAAAYAGATAYNRSSTTAAMTAAAQMVGRLNGVASTALTAQLAASPRGDGSQTVQVSISVAKSLLLAKVMGFRSDLTVSTTAYASLGGGTTACVVALSISGAGVTMSGGTALNAPQCGVASNLSITVPCGTSITAKSASYAGSPPTVGCSGLKDPSGSTLSAKQQTATDPLSGDASVTTATSRIATVTASAAPAAPSVTAGKPIEFAWNQSTTTAQATAIGCAASWTQPTWTLTCPAGGTYNFGTFAKLVVVGPISGTTAGATFAEGATTSFSGAFYFPKGPISLSGGASIGNGSGQCLQLIGSEVTISGGTTAASACLGGASSGGSVAVVQ